MVTPSLAYVPGTALYKNDGQRAAFEAALEDIDVSPAVLEGPFASNLWQERFEITGVLGRGAQGVTFAGQDKKTDRPVAIKLFDLGTAKDWKAHELFEREIFALAAIEHDQVPRFIDVLHDEHSGAKALVMERVLGEDLDVLLDREGPLREADLWRVLVEIAEVLTHLHDIQPPIVHRDIKPKNIVRRADGRHCLVDFGGVTAQSHKGASTVVGTFGYMAPEQLYGGATPATDVYALGATILCLATGAPPDEQPRKGLALDVDKACPGLSAPLRTVMREMLSPEPDQRPGSGQVLQDRLRKVRDTPADAPRPSSTGWFGRRKKPTKQERREAKQRERDQRRARRGKRPQPEVEVIRDTGKADARFDDEREPDETSALVTSGARMGIGVLGTVLVVAFGEIFLPLLLTVLAQFSAGSSKQKLLTARDKVQRASQVAKDGFGRTIEKGARGFEEIEHRQRRKQIRSGQPPKDRSRRRRR